MITKENTDLGFKCMLFDQFLKLQIPLPVYYKHINIYFCFTVLSVYVLV